MEGMGGDNTQKWAAPPHQNLSPQTFFEWDKILMGPMQDKLGVEKGGM